MVSISRNKNLYCGFCGKKFRKKEERYTVGFGHEKKPACSKCWDKRYGEIE